MAQKITELEHQILDWIAYNEMTELNGGRPENHTQAQCFCWVDEMANVINRSQNVVKGILGSLVNKGYITTNQLSAAEHAAGDADTIGMTEEGFKVWDEADRAEQDKAKTVDELLEETQEEAEEEAMLDNGTNHYVDRVTAIDILKKQRKKKYFISAEVLNYLADDHDRGYKNPTNIPVSRDYLIKEALHKEKGKYGPFRQTVRGEAVVRVHVLSSCVFVG